MKILKKRMIGEGKWLALEELEYADLKGITRKWETVSRKKCEGAVLLHAVLKPSGKIIFVRQLRPPTGKLILEFPAGLVDPGEAPEIAAVRELREETGYHGIVKHVSPPCYTSPGLTGESVFFVEMEVAESEQGTLQTEFDDGENIETLTVLPAELPALIEQEFRSGNGVDAKVIAFAASQRK